VWTWRKLGIGNGRRLCRARPGGYAFGAYSVATARIRLRAHSSHSARKAQLNEHE
jgi:hypothetical protein